MVETSFWIDLGNLFILETSMLVHFESSSFYFCGNILENTLSKIGSRPFPSCNILKNTIGSFHGLGKTSIWPGPQPSEAPGVGPFLF